MLVRMRVTLNIPDDLYRDVRMKAAQEGRTITAVVEDALRQLLAEEPHYSEPYRVRPLRTGGLSPGLDINDNSAVLDYLDSE